MRVNFPVHSGTGTAASAVVYFEVDPRVPADTHRQLRGDLLVLAGRERRGSATRRRRSRKGRSPSSPRWRRTGSETSDPRSACGRLLRRIDGRVPGDSRGAEDVRDGCRRSDRDATPRAACSRQLTKFRCCRTTARPAVEENRARRRQTTSGGADDGDDRTASPRVRSLHRRDRRGRPGRRSTTGIRIRRDRRARCGRHARGRASCGGGGARCVPAVVADPASRPGS